MRQLVFASIMICLLYGTSSFFFSFVSKFLFKIYHFDSFFLVKYYLETIIYHFYSKKKVNIGRNSHRSDIIWSNYIWKRA